VRPTEKSSKDKPLVTVVTVVLNDKEHVAETIESVLSQSYEKIEYIVMDGGSTDGTMDILMQYKQRIQHLVSEPDRGISHAFNKGLTLSRGEVVGILNAGDWYEPHAVASIVDAYLRNRSVDVFCGGVRYWADEEPELLCYSNPDLIHRETSIYHPTVFITQRGYQRFGLFDESFRLAMDYELLLRFKMKGAAFVPVSRVLANMRYEGLSTTNWMKGLLEVKQARARYFPKANVAFHHTRAVFMNLVAKILKGIGLESVYNRYWQLRNTKTVSSGTRWRSRTIP
jgi:glycosyltransferase involved in cell wall biosynthesis